MSDQIYFLLRNKLLIIIIIIIGTRIDSCNIIKDNLSQKITTPICQI